MVLEYNPALHGSQLSKQEIQYLTELEPNCTVFTPVDPELTPERVRRIKKYGRVRESETAYLHTLNLSGHAHIGGKRGIL